MHGRYLASWWPPGGVSERPHASVKKRPPRTSRVRSFCSYPLLQRADMARAGMQQRTNTTVAGSEHSSRTGRVYSISDAVCTGAGLEGGRFRGVGPSKTRKGGGKTADGRFGNVYKFQIPNATRIPWGKCAVSSARGWMPTSVTVCEKASHISYAHINPRRCVKRCFRPRGILNICVTPPPANHMAKRSRCCRAIAVLRRPGSAIPMATWTVQHSCFGL